MHFFFLLGIKFNPGSQPGFPGTISPNDHQVLGCGYFLKAGFFRKFKSKFHVFFPDAFMN